MLKVLVPTPRPDFGTSRVSLLGFHQIFAEEGQDICVELLVESHAIKACRVGAQLRLTGVGHEFREFLAARWKKREMARVWHDAVVWLGGQVMRNRCGIFG